MKEYIVIVLIHFCFMALLLGNKNSNRVNHGPIISQSLEDEIRQLVTEGRLPSLQVAIISDNHLIWSKTFRKTEGKLQLYKIGSIRKVIGSTAVLQMQESGLLNINEDINKYIPLSVINPDYPDTPVTIKMLLSHRSGLDIFQHQYEWDTRKLEYNQSITPQAQEILNLPKDKFIKESLDTSGINYDPRVWKFKPGTDFHYSNSAYLILEYLVEQVSGQPYEQFVHTNIFEPLEMQNTIFSSDDSTGSFLPAYTRKGDQNIKLPFWEGMFSTVEDMAKFMIANLNAGKYLDTYMLKPETVSMMHIKHSRKRSLFKLSGDCPFPGYGLGIMYYGDGWYGHGGSTIGYQSLWSFNKSKKKGYIIFTNINGLCHGKENFDSVWGTVSSVEKIVKSELGGSKLNWMIYIFIGMIGVISILIFLRTRK